MSQLLLFVCFVFGRLYKAVKVCSDNEKIMFAEFIRANLAAAEFILYVWVMSITTTHLSSIYLCH